MRISISGISSDYHYSAGNLGEAEIGKDFRRTGLDLCYSLYTGCRYTNTQLDRSGPKDQEK